MEEGSIAVFATMCPAEKSAVQILDNLGLGYHIYRNKSELLYGIKMHTSKIVMVCIQQNSNRDYIWKIFKALREQNKNVRVMLIVWSGYWEAGRTSYWDSLFEVLSRYSGISIFICPKKEDIEAQPMLEEEDPAEYFKGMGIETLGLHKPFSTDTFSNMN